MNLNENIYTDTMDVNFNISLHEYGIVRNPTTGDTVFCLNPSDNYEMDEQEYNYNSNTISFDDVKDAINEASDGYFSYIGCEKHEAIERLNNNFLTSDIFSLNQYNGHFSPFN